MPMTGFEHLGQRWLFGRAEVVRAVSEQSKPARPEPTSSTAQQGYQR